MERMNMTGQITTVQRPPQWHEQANCAGVDPELFFPETGRKTKASRQAKKICFRCDVRNECLQWALDNNEVHGVYGGTTPEQRKQIHRATECDYTYKDHARKSA